MKSSKNSLANDKTFSIKSQLKIIMDKSSRRNSTFGHCCNIEEHELFSCYDYPGRNWNK